MKKDNLQKRANTPTKEVSILDLGGNIITPKQFGKAIDKARIDYNTELYNSRKTIPVYIIYHPIF